MATLEWERLKSKGKAAADDPAGHAPGGHIYRSKVPGGWLLAMYDTRSTSDFGSVAFYPDPSHDWDGNSLL